MFRRTPAPQAGASTNSATRAYLLLTISTLSRWAGASTTHSFARKRLKPICSAKHVKHFVPLVQKASSWRVYQFRHSRVDFIISSLYF